MKFEDLGICDEILSAIKLKGYSSPTPIQERAIPQILKKKDILGCAQTGTGKTAAFAIPMIQLIHKIEKPGSNNKATLRSLIVTPTRELAIQIDENIRAYSKHTSVRHAVIFGGVKQGKQVEELKRGVHILIATPGRLLDLIQQGYINLSTIKIFVLDEADRMLDMGFINDIRKLLKLLPLQRQSLFFSATMPDNIVKLSKQITNNPVKIEVNPISSTAETVHQNLFYTNKVNKLEVLIHILENWFVDQALIFSRTKYGSDKLARKLKKAGFNADAIHGDKSQPQRQKSLKRFKSKDVKYLVATDIAARGIDIQKLKFVINYDIPNEPESYVHRIGRTGRAGEDGVAFSICEPEENAYIKSIEKLIGLKINIVDDHPHPQTDKPMSAAEKKELNKEKQRRKQEYFAQRRKDKERRSNPNPSKNNQKKKQENGNSKRSENRPSNKSINKDSKDPKIKQSESPQSNKPQGPRRGPKLPNKLSRKYMWPLE